MRKLLALFSNVPDLFERSRKGRTSPFAKLVLGMNKRHIGEADKAENVTQIGFLKIELLSSSAFLVGTPARSNGNNLLLYQQPLGALWPICNRLPDPHNLVDPCFEQG